MKKLLLWEILTHATLVLSAVFLVLTVIDRFNPAMEFIGSELSDWCLLLFCACALISSILGAVRLYRYRKERYEQIEWGDNKK